MPSTYVEHELPNGLRVVCEVMPTVRSAAVAFCARTGSRHEDPHVHGVSHFLEHMCFKGTHKRDWRELTVRFDELGSIYNAYTGKEHTVYYGWVPAERVLAQLELLADLVRPRLPTDEYETERKVILEEIAMAADSFDHRVWAFLHEVAFGAHPLGHEILGEKETIAALPHEHLVGYHARRYAPDNMLLLVAGAIEPEEIFAAAGRYCGQWQRSSNGVPAGAAPEPQLDGVHRLQLEQFQQQSLALIYPSIPYGAADEELTEAFTALFGGSNSRCYWNIVQKGICVQAGAVWLAYQDCGLMVLYADGDAERCEQMLAALREQAEAVCKSGFRPDEVQRVKNHRRTQLALEAENPRTRIMHLIDDVEARGYVRTTDARMAAVDAVSVKALSDHLAAYPVTGEGLLISAGPRVWP
ncbi:MAG: insulinase family protein [Planctomycetes bacterium]|nr:insulinase family protein [Planctomycetota bacterium]